MAIEENELEIQGTKAREALERFVVENDDLLELESRIGSFNIFDALKITHVEIRHSNFLAFLLDPTESHGQGQLFLNAILMDLLKKAPPESRPLSPIDLDGTDLRGVEIRREWKNIDLLIICQEPRFFIVIENKIRSKEGSDQLMRYEEAMQKHHPDARPLYVFLTRESDEPSEEKWMPYSHADVHRVLTRVRDTYSNAIGDDVLVFLNHYLSLLGTRFMNDKEIDELCRKIYKHHRQALRLIWDRVGNPASGVSAEVKSVLDEDVRWHVFYHAPNDIYFVPKAWLEWLPPFGIEDDLRYWIMVHIGSREGKVFYALSVGPMSDVMQRKEIVNKLLGECSNCGFRRSNSREVTDKWSRISASERILDWKDENEPDSEKIQGAVKKTLNELYPKLEKMALVLRPVCGLPASTK